MNSNPSRGAAVRVTFDVLEGQTFEGRIAYVGAVVNPRNRTFPVELRLPNPGGRIKPEMVANMAVTRQQVEAHGKEFNGHAAVR